MRGQQAVFISLQCFADKQSHSVRFQQEVIHGRLLGACQMQLPGAIRLMDLRARE